MQTGVRRLGDVYLAPFLIDYMERLPLVKSEGDDDREHVCTRQEFMRSRHTDACTHTHGETSEQKQSVRALHRCMA